ncbi:hypothetical protein [Lentilactobacillus kisonensis]|uniref:Uncharacterized protein n=1 Tax=Lentilactobacillus kisonensis DSM 19906 = JCM 15041 TaxID=1423766 RepID=A0A0R1NU20_9LACO|nr:hypothetical protein [Lentilactobacillus kisonensis]KRL20107.1 hypothetical protein FC98_GL001861 [Lentilactobacillus kisonensis DSM 19906 = JCM 15041]
MAYDLAKVTANGNNLIAQILANKSSLSVDKIEISDTQLPSTTDISTMTSVPKVVQTVSANGFSKNSNTLIISTVVDNSSISADYKAWVFGIWGSDSQNGQSQLIAVITSTNSPDTIPAFSGRTPVSYTYKFNIGFSNASQIQFNMIDDSFATNDTVVHTTGDETIDGQKKFKTDPTDSAGNAYAKTVDVNQQLDKKVNVSDMRKPASDVAGIEEVNAKQDKIGYTPADDSKVVHSTDTSNWQKQAMFNPGDYRIDSTTPTADFATLLRSKYDKGGIVYIRDNNGPSYAQIVDAVVICEGDSWWYAYGVTWDGIFAHRRIRATDDTGWVLNADDSKVAHLSGANNFDTVPTVNNNPLLLASSLPSDLARTGQDANFTGKLQKSGIDVATKSDVTTAVNTATSNVVTTDKLANFTAGLQSGGVSVATSDDLKSVEDSAWRQLDRSHINSNSTFVYKLIDNSNLVFFWQGLANEQGKIVTTTADLSSIFNGLKLSSACAAYYGVNIASNIVCKNNILSFYGEGDFYTTSDMDTSAYPCMCLATYTSLVN